METGTILRPIPTLFVADMDASVRFYSEILGLHIVHRSGDYWAELELGGSHIGLHPKAKDQAVASNSSIALGGLMMVHSLPEVNVPVHVMDVRATDPEIVRQGKRQKAHRLER